MITKIESLKKTIFNCIYAKSHVKRGLLVIPSEIKRGFEELNCIVVFTNKIINQEHI
jgi:hypothetical protein